VNSGGPEFFRRAANLAVIFSSIIIGGYSVIIMVNISWVVWPFGSVPLTTNLWVPTTLRKPTFIVILVWSKLKKDSIGRPSYLYNE